MPIGEMPMLVSEICPARQPSNYPGWTSFLFTMLLAVGAVHADPVQIASERFDLKGTFQAAYDGTCDLGNMSLRIVETPSSRIRNDVTISIRTTLVDPRTRQSNAFAVEASYAVMRDLILQESFTLRMNGVVHRIDPEDRLEERLLQTYLPMAYMALKAIDTVRYTVVLAKGKAAQFITLQRRPVAGGSEAVVLNIQGDIATDEDKLLEVARFGLEDVGGVRPQLRSIWVVVFDRPSLYFDILASVSERSID